MNNYNLLEKYEYLGEFWFSGMKKEKFPGLLIYSPTEGVVLKTQFEIKNKKNIKRLEELPPTIIYGFIQEIGPVTLMLSDILRISGGYTTGKIYCYGAIIGRHFTRTELRFNSVHFKFNNLNEFCFLQGFKMDDPYTKKAYLESRYRDYDLKLLKEAKGTFAPDKISKLFFINNNEYRDELDKTVDALKEKYGEKYLNIKTELNYYFELKSYQPVTLIKLIHNANEILNYFKCITLRNLWFTELTLISRSKTGRTSYSLLLSMYLDERQVTAASKDKSFHHLPVNLKGIENVFPRSIGKWVEFNNEKLSLVITTLLNHIVGHVDIFQQYIILLAAIEQWRLYKKNNIAPKYDWFVQTYARPEIVQSILKCLPKGAEINGTIGRELAEIRNYIIHPIKREGKEFKKYYKITNGPNVANLSEILFSLLIIGLYEELCIEKVYIEKVVKDRDFYFPTYYSPSEEFDN